MKARLTRLSGGKALRTAIVEGECDRLPRKGEPVVLIGAPLQSGNARVVTTSPVVEIEQPVSDGKEYIFTTHTGSKYHVEVLEDAEEQED